jgi:hypothetical protein
MSRRWILIGLMAAVVGLGACKHDKEPNKILNGSVVDVSQTVYPGLTVQEFVVLNQQIVAVIVPIFSRLGTTTELRFPELTPLGNSTYRFTVTQPSFGSAHADIQFKDPAGNVIDPIATTASTSTLASVTMAVTGASSLYSYTENLSMKLDTAGDTTSTKRMFGTGTFNGTNAAAGYSNLVFSFPSSGCESSFEGILAGTVNGAGTGPSAPVTFRLTFGSAHAADGTLSWEGRNGTIHMNPNGVGFIIDGPTRILIY